MHLVCTFSRTGPLGKICTVYRSYNLVRAYYLQALHSISYQTSLSALQCIRLQILHGTSQIGSHVDLDGLLADDLPRVCTTGDTDQLEDARFA